MPRFSDVAKGTRARKPVPFPIANTRCDLLADLPELAAQRARDRAAWEKAAQAGPAPSVASDDQVMVDLRVLTGAEESQVLQKARDYAIERGIESPTNGEPIYEIAKMAETLALGVIDHDSPEAEPCPFFDGGAKQLLDEVDGDRIAFLYARWEMWQGECSPRIGTLSGEQFYSQMVKVTVAEDDLPFTQMEPITRWVFARTLAALLLNSPEGKSLFTSAFGGTVKPETAAPSPRKSAARSKKR
jgi:hypothetical protein